MRRFVFNKIVYWGVCYLYALMVITTDEDKESLVTIGRGVRVLWPVEMKIDTKRKRDDYNEQKMKKTERKLNYLAVGFITPTSAGTSEHKYSVLSM